MSKKPEWVQRAQKEVAARRRRIVSEETKRKSELQTRQEQVDREKAQPIIASLQEMVEQAVAKGKSEVPLMTWRTEYGGSVPRDLSELYGAPMLVAQHCKGIGLETTLKREELPDRGEDDAVRYIVTLSIML